MGIGSQRFNYSMIKGVMDPDMGSGMASVFETGGFGGVSGKIRLARGWPLTSSFTGRTGTPLNVPVIHGNRPFKGMASGKRAFSWYTTQGGKPWTNYQKGIDTNRTSINSI